MGRVRGRVARVAAALFLGLAFTSAPVPAVELDLNPVPGAYDLAPFIEVFRDAAGTLPLGDVAADTARGRFSGLSTAALHLDADEVVWVRLRLRQGGPVVARSPWLLEVGNYRLDEMALFCGPAARGPEDRGPMLAEVAPFLPHEFGHRNPVFRIAAVQRGGETCFLRLRTHASMPVPLRMWSVSAFRRHAEGDSLAFGVVYGVLLSMALFNLFIYVSLRDRVYLLYVAYVTSMLVYLVSLNGQHMPLLGLPPGPGLVMLWCSLGVVLFFTLVFVKAFLDTSRSTPRLNHALTLIQVVAVGIFAFGLLGLNRPAHMGAVLAGLGLAPAGLAVGIVRLSQGFRPARYFLMAWTALLLGVTTLPLKELGLLPQAVPGELATNLGAAAESILLSFALADRIRILRREKEELTASQARYRQASLTDGLTGLFNRRYFEEALERAVGQAERYARPLSLLMLDVDEFKKFNDAHGHQAGDDVLGRLAELMRTSARQADSPCRYGGEEFVLLLPETALPEATRVAERLRTELAAMSADGPAGEPAQTTVSIGVAQRTPGEPASGLIQRADAALYRAKRRGKNRVEQDRDPRPGL